MKKFTKAVIGAAVFAAAAAAVYPKVSGLFQIKRDASDDEVMDDELGYDEDDDNDIGIEIPIETDEEDYEEKTE